MKIEVTWQWQCKWNNGEKFLAKLSKIFFPFTENSTQGKSNHKRQDLLSKEKLHDLSIILFLLENRLQLKKILKKGLIPLVCGNTSCGTSSPNMVTRCLRILLKCINNSRQRIWENNSSGTNSSYTETACLRNLICLSCLFYLRLNCQ